ncbi:amidohydrolase family protein [Variovorax rhizosphaerae]|uniref:Amidohydrolase family protein n=1 Tax=Variovorax rhizosphaerae TaxID=1836200 RepID=A0ABU8WU42_9BURK
MTAQGQVPNSSGEGKPRTAVPAGACDAHMHIFDRRFASIGAPDAMVDGATVDDYRLLQQRLGTQRTVVVQPRVHGTDNAVTLAAIQSLGPRQARGVAVVRPDVTDDELERLHAGGIRGIRFTLYTATHAAVDFSMVEPLAHRVHALGWHVQLHWSADQIEAHAPLLQRLPCSLVFDHLARLPQPDPQAHPAYAIVSRLLGNGRTWIKMSGAYLNSSVGAEGGYADTESIAQAWVRQAPERMVWGSDWPHSTEPLDKPDDAALFDLLARWVPDDATRHRVLVDNPAQLYQFS